VAERFDAAARDALRGVPVLGVLRRSVRPSILALILLTGSFRRDFTGLPRWESRSGFL